MMVFFLEYLNFVVAAFIITVTLSAAGLFFIAYKYETNLRVIWRAIGFCAIALSFFLFILERKFALFGLPAIAIQLFGFYSIYRGIGAEPSLQQLLKHRQ